MFIVLISSCVVGMEKETQKPGFFTWFFSSWAAQKAVNQEQEKLKAKFEEPGICYLELLPAEIQDHIAQYLVFRDRETDQELIARTQGMKQGCDENRKNEYLNGKFTLENRWLLFTMVLNAYNKKTNQKKMLCEFEHYQSDGSDDFLYSPAADCSKVIFLKASGISKSLVQVFDLLASSKKEERISGSTLNRSIYGHGDCAIGISCDGNIYARVWDVFESGKVFLRIGRLKGDDIMKRQITISEPRCVAFNKQGTKVIVRNNKEYEVFDLCSESEHNQKSRKILADYFRQRGICKNLLARNVA